MSVYYNDHDPQVCAWLRELMEQNLIPYGVVDSRSILEVTPDDLEEFKSVHFFAGIGGWAYALRLAGWADERPVWTGSPPCQPFSPAGRQDGKDDARHLAPAFLGLVRACRPGMLFGEQVASSLVVGRAATKPRHTATGAPEWAWFDALSDGLEAAGYACGASDISAASVGAPHIRQRLFFGAVGGEGLEHATSDRRAAWGAEPSRLADANQQRRARFDALLRPEASGRDAGKILETAGHCKDSRPDATDCFWSHADWLGCRDGKWRPVESGSFPLADGISARVGRLRGYGNAIVPQAAAEFIQTFVEAISDIRAGGPA